jgi:hypothetical protein
VTLLQENIVVANQLELALGDGRIPSKYHQWGAHLLTHLRKPIQIAFIGKPKSGKSSLINMMLGRQNVAVLGGSDIVEIGYGPHLRTTFEYADGSLEHHDGLITDAQRSEVVIRARLEMPEQILRLQTFIEIRVSGAPARQESLLLHAIQSSAIIVYCSEEFGEDEQHLWSNVPDEMKDHSFLALTMADRAIIKECLTQRIVELEGIASEEFLGLYPIATLQAIAARSDSVAVRPDLWSSSGGKDIYEGLEHQIECGRTEDLDKAGMLLTQFAADPTSGHPEASSVPAERKQEQPAAERLSTEVGTRIAPSAGAEHDISEVLQGMLNTLQKCADEMLRGIPAFGDVDPSQIVTQCAQAISDMSDTLANVDCSDPVIKDIQEDARGGEEMMLLLQLEAGEEAATDAVVLLIQLKKEISKRACG